MEINIEYDAERESSSSANNLQQLQALYSNQTVKILYVQIHKGSKDCGCFAIALLHFFDVI